MRSAGGRPLTSGPVDPRDAAGADVHAALSSPTRRRLLALLRADDAARDAHDLAQVVGLHLTTVRFHLEVLRRAGLLGRSSSPQAGAGRPRTVYAAVSAARADVSDGYGSWRACWQPICPTPPSRDRFAPNKRGVTGPGVCCPPSGTPVSRWARPRAE